MNFVELELKAQLIIRRYKFLTKLGYKLSRLSTLMIFVTIFIILKIPKYTKFAVTHIAFQNILNIISAIILLIMVICIYLIKYSRLYADLLKENIATNNNIRTSTAAQAVQEVVDKLAPYLEIYRQYGNDINIATRNIYYDLDNNRLSKAKTIKIPVLADKTKQYPDNEIGIVQCYIRFKDDAIVIGGKGSRYRNIEHAMRLKYLTISLSHLLEHNELKVIYNKSKVKGLEKFLSFAKGKQNIQRVHYSDATREVLYFDTDSMKLEKFSIK